MREIDGEWPIIEEAIMPDNIQWQNMGFPKSKRRLRGHLVNILAVIVIIVAFILIL